jgi:phosphoglycolate phosphatase
MSMIDSVIFDLDGTLWSCVDTLIEAWNQVLVAKGVDEITEQQLQSVLGLQHDRLAEKLLPFLMDSEKLELIEEIYRNEVALIRKRGGELFDNTIPVLNNLSTVHPLFIVSNCQRGYIEAFLDYYKFNALITDYESSGNTGRGKAYNIGLIIKEYDLRNPVYIGDTIGDLQACEEVGIPFIYADYGFGGGLEVLYQISDIGDLINTDILEHIYV